ncbi:BnaA07g08700D [Brassica napus]|uniref:BnaA07g08700D protein n=1 Tax=Brassica napus TaxID=3708 RepID=A0A078FS28_BRANA|nr:BnaA07g08700D [Brassica napus]
MQLYIYCESYLICSALISITYFLYTYFLLLKYSQLVSNNKLLGISPSSPDAAVFTSNATSTTTPAAPAGKSPATPTTSMGTGGSPSIRDGHATVALAFALIMTVSFVSILPRMGLA